MLQRTFSKIKITKILTVILYFQLLFQKCLKTVCLQKELEKFALSIIGLNN